MSVPHGFRAFAFLLALLSNRPLIMADESTAVARGCALFQAKCTSCHSINGGDIVGPDLAEVTVRRDSRWLDRFIRQPDLMLSERDPTALFLLQKYFLVAMPNSGISEEDCVWLLAYLSARGRRPAPARAPSEPIAAASSQEQAPTP